MEDLKEIVMIKQVLMEEGKKEGLRPEDLLELKDISIPVGRVKFLHMHPLCFAEYLQGIGREDAKNSGDTLLNFLFITGFLGFEFFIQKKFHFFSKMIPF